VVQWQPDLPFTRWAADGLEPVILRNTGEWRNISLDLPLLHM